MNKKYWPYIISVLLLVLIAILLLFALTKPCGYCASDGLVKCTNCKKGKLDCITCSANGYMYCETCQGLGKIKCSDCNGVGYTIGDTCDSCGGDGESLTFTDLSNVGSSELLSKIYINPRRGSGGIWYYTCGSCVGTGIERFQCHTCNSNGKHRCADCSGKRFGDVCSDCNGSKKVSCPECIGTATLTCNQCNGSGKLFIWK